jgi:ferric-chelate reductase [NAD(P)H]
VGEVEDAKNLSDVPVMTYAYYHSVLKGKTPPKASSFIGEA